MKRHYLIDFISISCAVTVLLISVEKGGRGELWSLSPRDRLLKQANELGLAVWALMVPAAACSGNKGNISHLINSANTWRKEPRKNAHDPKHLQSEFSKSETISRGREGRGECDRNTSEMFILDLSLMYSSWYQVPCVFACKRKSEVASGNCLRHFLIQYNAYVSVDSFIVSVSLKIIWHVYVDVRECVFMCLCTLWLLFFAQTGYSGSNHIYLELTEQSFICQALNPTEAIHPSLRMQQTNYTKYLY